MVRQLADEAHRIGGERLVALPEIHDARGRIQRGEEAVFDEQLAAGECLKNRGLAGVGVADDRHSELIPARLSSRLPGTGDPLQLRLEVSRCGGR